LLFRDQTREESDRGQHEGYAVSAVFRRQARAVFLDNDGTLIENLPYNVDPAAIQLTTGAAEGLLMLSRYDYRFFVVSHHPGIALGIYGEGALRPVEQRITQLLQLAGAELGGFYYCPHSPRSNLLRYTRECDCRKPAAGLIARAAREHGIALQNSWLMGDTLDDIESGKRAGCRTVLIDNGSETEWNLVAARRPDRVASDLFEAAALVAGAEEPQLGRRR